MSFIRLVIYLVFFGIPSFSFAGISDEIQIEKEKIQSLQRKLDPLIAPLRHHERQFYVAIRPGLMESLVDKFNQLPQKHRTISFDSTGQKAPLIEKKLSGYNAHCGYDIKLRNNSGLDADFRINRLDAGVSNDGAIPLKARLGLDANINLNWRLFVPDTVTQCTVTSREVCGWRPKPCRRGAPQSECRYWTCWWDTSTRCYVKPLPCNQGSRTKLSGSLKTSLEFKVNTCTLDYCPRIYLRTFTDEEVPILALLSDRSSLSIGELQVLTSLPIKNVQKSIKVLSKMGMVIEFGGKFSISSKGLEFYGDRASVVVYELTQPLSEVLPAKACAPIPVFGSVCFDIDIDAPKGVLSAGATKIDISLSEKIEVDLPGNDVDYQLPFLDRVLVATFQAKSFKPSNSNFQIDGKIEFEWGDVLRWKDYLNIHVIDVGEGHSIWMQAPNFEGHRKTMLIDGGPKKDKTKTAQLENRSLVYHRMLGLREADVVDYQVLSKPVASRTNAVSDFLKRYQVKTLISSGTAKGLSYPDNLSYRNISFDYTDIDFGKNVSVKIIYPLPNSANKGSIILRAEYQQFSALFLNDADSEIDAALYQQDQNTLDSTILFVANSTDLSLLSNEVLQRIKPRLAVLSGGVSSSTQLNKNKDIIASLFPEALILSTDKDDAEEGRTNSDDSDGDDIFIAVDDSGVSVFQADIHEGKRKWSLIK